MATVLFYTTGRKPFVQRFFEEHLAQAERLDLDFVCIAANLWRAEHPQIRLQEPASSRIPYTGLLEAILQGLRDLPEHECVFLAEDDCLYLDARFSEHPLSLAQREPTEMIYQRNVSFISAEGFFRPTIDGICLHSAYGTAAALRHNITHKLAEYKGETAFPASSVEPVAWPTRENRSPENANYRTILDDSKHSLSLDFRGYGQQTWRPDGSEPIWQHDEVWGDAALLWSAMIAD